MRLYLNNADQRSQFELDDGEYLVGRSPGADIRLTRGEVSSEHALLRIDGNHLFVSDLGSRNGTDIDGVPITSGNHESEVPPQSTVHVAGVSLSRLDATSTSAGMTTCEHLTPHIHRDVVQGYVGISPHNVGEMLRSLFALIADTGIDEDFDDRACSFVSRWVNCDRVVLMLDFGPGSPHAVWGSWSKNGEDKTRIVPNESIIAEVCEKRCGLFRVWPSERLPTARGAAAMAVPLFDNDRVRGILCAETFSPLVEFDCRDLDVLTASANAIAVKLRNRDLVQELTVAKRIQSRMCPTHVPTVPGYEVAARVESCFAIGGDFFHVSEPLEGRVVVALGDVAGKGLPAALAMAACSVLIPALGGFCHRPCALVQQLHRTLWSKLSRDQYVTLFLAELELDTGRMRYVNAGHVAPMLLRNSGDVEHLNSTGGVIGMFPEFTCQGRRTRLQRGDLLTVFSDGVTEATLYGDEFFERESAEEVVLRNSEAELPELMDLMFAEINAFLKGGHGSDDTTLLMLRRRA